MKTNPNIRVLCYGSPMVPNTPGWESAPEESAAIAAACRALGRTTFETDAEWAMAQPPGHFGDDFRVLPGMPGVLNGSIEKFLRQSEGETAWKPATAQLGLVPTCGRLCSLFQCNRTKGEYLTGFSTPRDVARALRAMLGEKTTIVVTSPKTAVAIRGDDLAEVASFKSRNVDATNDKTGVGAVFFGTFVYAISNGASLEAALADSHGATIGFLMGHRGLGKLANAAELARLKIVLAPPPNPVRRLVRAAAVIMSSAFQY